MYTKLLKTFLGKSKVCDMKITSGAFDKSIYDGNTILLGIENENKKHRWINIGGDKICSFLTDDDIFIYFKYGSEFNTL